MKTLFIQSKNLIIAHFETGDTQIQEMMAKELGYWVIQSLKEDGFFSTTVTEQLRDNIDCSGMQLKHFEGYAEDDYREVEEVYGMDYRIEVVFFHKTEPKYLPEISSMLDENLLSQAEDDRPNIKIGDKVIATFFNGGYSNYFIEVQSLSTDPEETGLDMLGILDSQSSYDMSCAYQVVKYDSKYLKK